MWIGRSSGTTRHAGFSSATDDLGQRRSDGLHPVTAVVLTCQKYVPLAEHMIDRYDTVWPVIRSCSACPTARPPEPWLHGTKAAWSSCRPTSGKGGAGFGC